MADETKYIKAENIEIPVSDDELPAEIKDVLERFEAGDSLSDDDLKMLVASVSAAGGSKPTENKNCGLC